MCDSGLNFLTMEMNMTDENTEFNRAAFDLTTALQPVRRAWRQAAVEAIRDDDISVSLAAVVLMIYRIGPMAQQKHIALEVGINAAALVRMLDKGEESGLLVRADNPEDRRSKIISLLPAGKTLAIRMEEKLTRLRRRLFDGVPPDQINTAARVLRLLEERCQAFLVQD